MAALEKNEVEQLYSRRARRYDITANLYYLIGVRERAYRKSAVNQLNLSPGDMVVEIGCGTGLNFPLLQQAVGPEGRIIGVDLTAAMLAEAQKKITRRGWKNVELVHTDAAVFEFPQGVNGILSTFAITLVPEFDRVIKNGAAALAPDGRLVIMDLKKPDWPMWLIKLGIAITRPFGVSLAITDRQPWVSVAKYCQNAWRRDLFFGSLFLAVGEAGGSTE